jgi:hypothetical protein
MSDVIFLALTGGIFLALTAAIWALNEVSKWT